MGTSLENADILFAPIWHRAIIKINGGSSFVIPS